MPFSNFTQRILIILIFFSQFLFFISQPVSSTASAAADCTNLDYIQQSFQFSSIQGFTNPGTLSTDFDQYGYRWTDYQSLGIRFDIPYPGDIIIFKPYAPFFLQGNSGELYPRNTDATYGYIGKVDSASPLEINGKKYFKILMRSAGWVHNITGGPFQEAGCPNITTSSILIEQNTRSISYWGKIFEITSSSGKFSVDIGYESSKNGSWISLQPITGGESQKWLLEPATDGFFRLISLKSGSCLGVPEDIVKDKAEITVGYCGLGENQMWKFTFDKESPLMIKQSQKVMDISGGLEKSGVTLIQNSASNSTSQDWDIVWNPYPKCHLKGKTICKP